MHYDNPDGLTGLVDDSGFRITFTKNFRQYDGGALSIGDPFVSGRDIPAGRPHSHYEFECTPSCTTRFPNDITVFAQW